MVCSCLYWYLDIFSCWTYSTRINHPRFSTWESSLAIRMHTEVVGKYWNFSETSIHTYWNIFSSIWKTNWSRLSPIFAHQAWWNQYLTLCILCYVQRLPNTIFYSSKLLMVYGYFITSYPATSKPCICRTHLGVYVSGWIACRAIKEGSLEWTWRLRPMMCCSLPCYG